LKPDPLYRIEQELASPAYLRGIETQKNYSKKIRIKESPAYLRGIETPDFRTG